MVNPLEVATIVQQSLFYLLLILAVICMKEIKNGLKIFFWKRKAVKIRMVGADQQAATIIAKKKDDNSFEFEGYPFFINPKKGIKEDGMVVYTYIMGNTFSHDFMKKPKELLQELAKIASKTIELQNKKGKISVVADLSEEFHEVYDEAYRVDSRMLKELLMNAQLSNKTLWDELIKIFKNKNIMTFAIIIIIGVGIAILLGWSTYDKVTHLPLCSMPKTVNI